MNIFLYHGSLIFMGLSVLFIGQSLFFSLGLLGAALLLGILYWREKNHLLALQSSFRGALYWGVATGITILFAMIIGEANPDPNHFLKESGKIAIILASLSLLARPVGEILKSYREKINLFHFLLARKILGIFAGLTVFTHGISYIQIDWSYFDFTDKGIIDFIISVASDSLGRNDVLIGSFTALLFGILLITSYRSIIQALKKNWKKVHFAVFPIYFLSILHVAFSGHLDELQFLLSFLVIGTRVWADVYLVNKEKKKTALVLGISLILFVIAGAGMSWISAENECTSVRAYTSRCLNPDEAPPQLED